VGSKHVLYMGLTKVDVEASTRDELKNLKADLGEKNLSDVIQALVDHYKGRDAPVAEKDEDGGLEAMEEEDEENERVPQLFSFETLVQEEKAIKYFTGLTQSCMDWVMKAMVDAVRPFIHFRGFLVWHCC
jgi:molybdopterin converting factor small subunit